jgi:hypothetical protein
MMDQQTVVADSLLHDLAANKQTANQRHQILLITDQTRVRCQHSRYTIRRVQNARNKRTPTNN